MVQLLVKNQLSVEERLFDDFFRAAHGTLQSLENDYNVKGVVEQVFGAPTLPENESQAHFRNSVPWSTLSRLYDYALKGETGDVHPIDIVISGSNVLKLATSENDMPSAEWDRLVAMGDGRFALDDGQPVELSKVALLAKVDSRTVRNAIAAGELKSFKHDDEIRIENASARQWLLGRRGFKPTVIDGDHSSIQLKDVSTPHQFGALLSQKNKQLNLTGPGSKTTPLPITGNAQAQLESGIFTLPLDAVFPLADFYQLDRKELLDCVMRVFFTEELQMLTKQ
ncbi:hypothetical protein [Rhodoferax sp.]